MIGNTSGPKSQVAIDAAESGPILRSRASPTVPFPPGLFPMPIFEIIETIERPDTSLVDAFSKIPVANLSDAMGNFHTMDGGIRALSPGTKICGPACTAAIRCGDNATTICAMDIAQAGDILVIDNQGDSETALMGEIMATECHQKGLAGWVCDGPVRDATPIREIGFSVFCRGTVPRVAGRDGPGEVNVPIQCGRTVVEPGDIVCADDDGVVAVPLRKAHEVLEVAQRIMAYEEELLAKIKSGKTQCENFEIRGLLSDKVKAHPTIV